MSKEVHKANENTNHKNITAASNKFYP